MKRDALKPRGRLDPILPLTQDGLNVSHIVQTRRLCDAGARWIQLRMKNAGIHEWTETARAVSALCRQRGVLCIVNDSVEVAKAAGADGVHLGKHDLSWEKAREELGPDALLGGTVNNADDARRAVACGCLDYVGVGPWRFTANKRNLSPLLGPDGIGAVLNELGGIPAWVIGGIEAEDVPEARRIGAAGVAVSSALFRGDDIEAHFQRFRAAWAPPLGRRPDPS